MLDLRTSPSKPCRDGARLLLYAGGFAPIGGVETLLHDLMLGMAERGVAAEMICWGGGSELLSALGTRGLRVRRLPWRWGCRWNWPDRLLRLTGGKAVQRADVVIFAKMLDDSTLRSLASRRERAGPPYFVLVAPYRPSEMWGAGAPPDDVINCFDLILVQAASFVDGLRASGYRGDIRVLPLPPPVPTQASPFPPASVLRIGYLGRLASQKNLPYLLESIGIVRQTREVSLEVYGDGAEKAQLQALARQLGLERQVTFHGTVRRAAIPAAIASCHCFAFSSFTEGQCLAALEILACGRPIVATPVGAFPETLSDSRLGILAPLADPDAYAAALCRLGEQVIAGALQPKQVQEVYLLRYPHKEVLDAYARLFLDLHRGPMLGET